MTLKSYYPELFPAGPIIPEKVEIIPFDLHEVMQSLGPTVAQVWLAEASPAADKAKKLGLHYLGYAKWADKSGKYVAKTIDGKLAKVSPQEAEKYSEKSSKKADSETERSSDYSARDEAFAANILGKELSGPKGSNPGGIWKGRDGTKRYVKIYENPNQAYTEKLANEIYNSVGADAPESVVFDYKGKTYFASNYLSQAETLNNAWENRPDDHKEIAKKIVANFATDVLLANWDVIGLDADNIVLGPQGTPYRIDNGGSLLFRAQGQKKDVKTLTSLGEIKTFFDPTKNSNYAEMLKTAGYKNIEQFSSEFIKQVVAIVKTRHNWHGWKSYMQHAVDSWKGKERDLTAKILEVRTNKLIHLAKQLQKAKGPPKKPLQESKETADKAKKLGLHYLGYGKWANSSGKYIAKTVNDKLIKVSPQESNQHHAKVSAWPSYKDKYAAHQSQPKEPPKEQPKQKPEPTDTTSILRKLRVNKGQEFLKKTLVKGEEVHVLSDTGLFGGTVDTGDNADDELNKYKQAHDYFSGGGAAFQKNNKQKAHAYLDATQQAKLWRSKLPLKEATKLLEIQDDWSRHGQWLTAPMSRKSRNRFLNSVIGSKHPPIVHTKIPLERGMSIKNKDIKSFLANFSIGKYATLPPSGYTAVPYVAREFLRGGEHEVGVLLRVHPHNGKAIGLHLAKTNVALKPIKKQLRQQYMKDRKAVHDKWVKYKNTWLKKHPKPSSKKFKNDEKWYDAYEDWKNALENITAKERYERYELEDHYNDSIIDWNDSYNDEHEVIRPGNAMGKVMKISKYLLHSTFDKEFTPYYIIDMQEAGLTRNKKMIKEETQETPEQKQQKLLQRATLYKYVNGPINMFKKAKEKVLKKYTNSPVRQEK